MAHVKSEGYGAEWIEVPDELLLVLEKYAFYLGELIFVVSRKDEYFECFFALERKSNGQLTRTMFLSTGWSTTQVPTWVSFPGVPQFLFDNLLAPLLKHEHAFSTGYVPKIS
jgi:hypothetical protein